jgi:hypothetical protein
MVTSLNGWPVPPKKLVTKKVNGADRRLTLAADAAPLLLAVAADYNQSVKRIDVGKVDDGGYNDRDANGAPGKKSNHASGTAIDLDWSEEGAQGSNWGKKFFAQAKTKIAITLMKKRYGQWIQWGGDWRAQDFMHWEIKPGVTAADVEAACLKLGIDGNGVRKG